MLELAYPNKDELQKKFNGIAFVDKYKFNDTASYVDHNLKLTESTWEALECISKQDNEIVGYFAAYIDRDCGYVKSLMVTNFGDKNIEFSRDFRQFLIDLFLKYSFYKVNFKVIVGNPAEDMYDRFIAKYGGKIAAYYEKDTKLWDGLLYDVKEYEIMRDKFIEKYGE
jgi:hypothetical protein